jgi:hypothetical protein
MEAILDGHGNVGAERLNANRARGDHLAILHHGGGKRRKRVSCANRFEIGVETSVLRPRGRRPQENPAARTARPIMFMTMPPPHPRACRRSNSHPETDGALRSCRIGIGETSLLVTAPSHC